ncbi:MAG: hypothetical protein M0Z28_06925 [Rhodospirillales bacterium]|nr:hypothetical protein [Rhodospirillales bacterium]
MTSRIVRELPLTIDRLGASFLPAFFVVPATRRLSDCSRSGDSAE